MLSARAGATQHESDAASRGRMHRSLDKMLTVMSSRCRRGHRISILIFEFTRSPKSTKLDRNRGGTDHGRR